MQATVMQHLKTVSGQWALLCGSLLFPKNYNYDSYRLDLFALPAQDSQMKSFQAQELETRIDMCCADARTSRASQALEYVVGNSLLQRCVLGHPKRPGNKTHLQNVPRVDPCNETCLWCKKAALVWHFLVVGCSRFDLSKSRLPSI